MYMLEIKKPNAIGIMSEIKFDYDDYDYRISSKLLEIYFLYLSANGNSKGVFVEMVLWH